LNGFTFILDAFIVLRAMCAVICKLARSAAPRCRDLPKSFHPHHCTSKSYQMMGRSQFAREQGPGRHRCGVEVRHMEGPGRGLRIPAAPAPDRAVDRSELAPYSRVLAEQRGRLVALLLSHT